MLQTADEDLQQRIREGELERKI